METLKVISLEDKHIELKRILNYSLFKNSPTLSKFLEYIVTETLHDRDNEIKEYNIAVNVLSRAASFNCNDDAIVRIHAGRLRRTLDLYYNDEGANNEIYIDIPKGRYVPQFKIREKKLENSSTDKPLPVIIVNPTVAIFPFKHISHGKEEEMFSVLLGEEVSAELSRFQDISVIAYYSMEMTAKINQNILEAGKLVGADYIITGSIQFIENKVRIRINLLITATGEVLMTKSLEKDVKFGMFEIQDEIVKSFIGAIGGYYGTIFQEIARASPVKASSNLKIREGIFSYYNYQRSYTLENFKIAVSTLEEAINLHPDNAQAMAMLGELYLDGIVLGVDTVPNPLERGYECCSEAVRIDPYCQHAWHSLTWVYIFKREKELCLQAALQCVELNPNCSVLTCGAGFALVCVGYFEEGYILMDKGIKINPYYPWWINTGLSLYFIHKEDYASAFYWAQKVNSDETFWDPLLKLVCLANMDNLPEAKKSLSKLYDLVPDPQTQIKKIISDIIFSEKLVSQIIGGLELSF
jgi:TolB-like protein